MTQGYAPRPVIVNKVDTASLNFWIGAVRSRLCAPQSTGRSRAAELVVEREEPLEVLRDQKGGREVQRVEAAQSRRLRHRALDDLVVQRDQRDAVHQRLDAFPGNAPPL